MGARASLLAGCVLLLAVLVPAVAGCSSGSSQSDYDKGYRLGLEAYTYGLPLMVTNATFQTMTSVNVSNGAYGPVNQFNNVRSAEQRGQQGGRGAGIDESLVDRVARPRRRAAGAARSRGHRPLLRTGPDRPLHRERQEPGHRQQHEAGRLRDRRSRSARGEDPCGDAADSTSTTRASGSSGPRSSRGRTTSPTSTRSRTATR